MPHRVSREDFDRGSDGDCDACSGAKAGAPPSQFEYVGLRGLLRIVTYEAARSGVRNGEISSEVLVAELRREYWLSGRKENGYFAAFLIAAHRAFCASDIAALAFAETFRFGRFPGRVPIGTTGCAVVDRPGRRRSGIPVS